MDWIMLFVYGVIQGVTEFLPVSSSGHLALLPRLFSSADPGVAFDLLMHVGTALAVVVYYYREIILLIKSFVPAVKGLENKNTIFLKNFVMATVGTLIIVFLIKSLAKEYGRGPQMIAFNLFFFGILMYLVDKRSPKGSALMQSSFNIKKSLLIGFAQAIAVFPGVSRSGITLTVARAVGLTKEDSTNFSFLLSLPIIFGGIIFMIPDLKESNVSVSALECLFAVGISFLFGLLTIHWFLKMIKKMGLLPFAIYRIILALIVYLYGVI